MAPLLTEAPSDASRDLDFDLDVTFIESGAEVDRLIHMTDDGCNSTCATACNSCR